MDRVPEHPAQAHPPRTGGWAEAKAPVAQRILSGLLIQWSRVRFPGKQLAASSLPWPPSEQGETSTVARWSQEDMVLGLKVDSHWRPAVRSPAQYGPGTLVSPSGTDRKLFKRARI